MSGERLAGWFGGGLVALGVGLAIGIANAPAASAAPGNSSDSASTHRGAASSARGAQTTARRAPAARVSQAVATRSAQTPQQAAGVARAARPQVESRAAASTSPARNPLDAIVMLKGWQLALPPQLVFFVKQVVGSATFTDDTKYDLHNVDQYDWNKLTGISFTLLHPDDNAIMVAWRYNVDTQMFEIGPYYNMDFARIMPTDDEIISVPVDGKFTFNVDYQGITLRYGDTVVYKPLPAGLHPNQLSAFRINSWFGGTSNAPKTIWYYMQLKPWWLTL
ncbi:hypothetical protein ACTXG7_16180 [Mycolicibacterium sp. Dal123E01]|uniref:hypothetical protein n=1 Tax=Mycolicibacterium sp. Dal123E01 TaxID=3457578 RepID=UPI00403EA7F4